MSITRIICIFLHPVLVKFVIADEILVMRVSNLSENSEIKT